MDNGLLSGFWRLSVRDSFSAAHALRNHGGKCENTHGHNFNVEIRVEGDALDPETGMLVDFSLLKKLLRQILERLDHKDLNSEPPFDRANPSSENLARHIAERMGAEMARWPECRNATLVAASVSEKPAQGAEWIMRMQRN